MLLELGQLLQLCIDLCSILLVLDLLDLFFSVQDDFFLLYIFGCTAETTWENSRQQRVALLPVALVPVGICLAIHLGSGAASWWRG